MSVKHTYTSNIVKDATGKFTLQWKEGTAVICQRSISVIGTDDEVQKCLLINLQALRDQNASLFIEDIEETGMPAGEEGM